MATWTYSPPMNIPYDPFEDVPDYSALDKFEELLKATEQTSPADPSHDLLEPDVQAYLMLGGEVDTTEQSSPTNPSHQEPDMQTYLTLGSEVDTTEQSSPADPSHDLPEPDVQAYLTLGSEVEEILDTTEQNLPTNPPYDLPEPDIQAYLTLGSEVDQLLDTTEKTCEFCHLKYAGFDLLMHIHFVHNAGYSDVCPCESCVVIQLNKTAAVRTARTQSYAGAAKLAGESAVVTRTRVAGDERSARVEHSRKRSLEELHQRFPPSHVAHSRNTSLQELHQRFPATQGPPSTPSSTKHAAINNSAPMNSIQVIRVDSASPMQTHPTPFSQAKPSTHVIRVDSASPMQTHPTQFVPAKPSKPKRSEPTLLPNNIRFCSDETLEISERNLPYEVSQIECGDLYEHDGQILWIEKKVEPALDWLDGDDNKVISVVTGKPMKWLPFFPHIIPRDVHGWQLVRWYRQAAVEGITIRHQDIYDRMHDALTSSGITNRVQTWQRGVGMLAQTRAMNYNWPSKHAMDTIAGLNYTQARFNTWWDVQYLSKDRVYIARQPQDHAGYRYPVLGAREKKPKMPHYFIENPEHRQISDHVRLIDDAMLFLTIKAEECGMKKGYQELLPWFGLKAGDKWTRDLDTDLVLEFERWREGCPDTPSVSVLRAALDHAGSQAEAEAIKNADYSLTPWLQDVVTGLAPVRAERRQKDDLKRIEIGVKVAKRKNDKRRIEMVDDVEEGAGEGSKRRAT